MIQGIARRMGIEWREDRNGQSYAYVRGTNGVYRLNAAPGVDGAWEAVVEYNPGDGGGCKEAGSTRGGSGPGGSAVSDARAAAESLFAGKDVFRGNIGRTEYQDWRDPSCFIEVSPSMYVELRFIAWRLVDLETSICYRPDLDGRLPDMGARDEPTDDMPRGVERLVNAYMDDLLRPGGVQGMIGTISERIDELEDYPEDEAEWIRPEYEGIYGRLWGLAESLSHVEKIAAMNEQWLGLSETQKVGGWPSQEIDHADTAPPTDSNARSHPGATEDLDEDPHTTGRTDDSRDGCALCYGAARGGADGLGSGTARGSKATGGSCRCSAS